jgi:hypothetical protein
VWSSYIDPSEIQAYTVAALPQGRPPSKDQNTRDTLIKLAGAIGIKKIPVNRTRIDIVEAIAKASPEGFRWIVENQGRRLNKKADIDAFKAAAGFA